ncbi:MAG TPA: hypothetical protein VJ894_06115, partial [Cryomorphaceae bacterium]|nr:hypothetical protein [Cryomorphaceae bacterium]
MTEETIDHYESPRQTRPTLLTVLCVLTWVVSGYTILTVPFNYFFSSEVTASTFQETINDAMAEMAEDSPEAAEMMEGFMMAASSTVSNAIDNAGW